MAQTTSALEVIIRRFCAELEKLGIHSEQVLLFGSYATGTAREDSDIDLFVVSSDWARYNDRERLEMLGIAAARILEPIEAYGVTPEEVASHRLPPFWEHVFHKQAIVLA